MNRFANQCYERLFCDFCKSSFSIRGSGTVHWLPVSSLKSGMKHLRRYKSYQFQPPKCSQKEVSVLELSKSKSSVQREVGCWCFPKLASFAQKYHILYSSRGECSNCAKSWRKAEGPAQPLPKLLPYKVRPNKRTRICSSIAFLC